VNVVLKRQSSPFCACIDLGVVFTYFLKYIEIILKYNYMQKKYLSFFTGGRYFRVGIEFELGSSSSLISS
jgi:hypothetical protein